MSLQLPIQRIWRYLHDFKPVPRAFPILMELMSLLLLGAFLGGLAYSQLPRSTITEIEKQVMLTSYQVTELQRTSAAQQVTIDSQATQLARIEGIGWAVGGFLAIIQILKMVMERKTRE